MPGTLTVHLERPIASAKVHANCPDGIRAESSGRGTVDSGQSVEQISIQDVEAQKAAFSQACQAVNSVAAKLNEFYDKVFVEHREEIARLSVEIARKILVQKVEDGDYEIESIVKEAINNAPVHQDVVVHLNPEDLVQYQKLQQDERSEDFAGIKFVPDPNIGAAECLLETPKGIIESVIDQHLDQVGKALKKVK